MKQAYFPLFAACIALLAGEGVAQEFHVGKGDGNQVKFFSTATLESFSGVTDDIDGYIIYASDDSLEASEIHIEVALDQLDTGIGLRNRHMRENYLQTDKHPLAIYHGKATAVRQDSLNLYQVTAKGIFSLHGVDKEMEVTAAVRSGDRSARVTAEFIIKLEDFGIKVPRLMFMKVSEVMPIHVEFTIKQVNP